MSKPRHIPPTKFDYYIQLIIIIPFCIGLVIPYVGWAASALLAMPLGAWQVLSAMYYVFSMADQKRVPYLISFAIYAAVFLLAILFEPRDPLLAFIIWGLGIGAVVLAIWYFGITANLHTNRDFVEPAKVYDPNILDDGDWEVKP